jgi:L-ascorbate metabolism protein UlaG (beta-lactamase superfamily)
MLIRSMKRRAEGETRPPETALSRIEHHRLAAAWLGHASVLARLGEANVLVDPVFSDRIGMRVGKATMGPRRLGPLSITADELPKIDLLLITHAHFDHLDKPTLRRLVRPDTVVVTACRTRRLIPRGYGAVVELAAGQKARVDGLRITAIKPAHWGARKLVDWRRGYNGYLVESPQGSILFAGDTAYTEAFAGIGPLDLAVFGIGSYDPWECLHATPEQVWSMFQGTGATQLLPIHHSTFQLSDEPIEEPMQRLLRAADGELGRVVQVAPFELWAGCHSTATPAGS